MLCRICTAVDYLQIYPRNHVLDDADCTAPTRQHELDYTDEDSCLSALKYMAHLCGIR